MQIYSKNNKNCFFSLISWLIFILFVLSDRARWRLQNLYTKFWNSLIMLIYANLRSPRRDPGVQSAFFFFFFIIITFFSFFFHVPSGASNLYFSHSNFCLACGADARPRCCNFRQRRWRRRRRRQHWQRRRRQLSQVKVLKFLPEASTSPG